MKSLYLLRAILPSLFLGLLFSTFCYANKVPKVWNTSNANSYFIGREEQLQKIQSFFKNGTKRILAITGGPGFGKTQITKKYAQQFYKEYDVVWWVDAHQDLGAQYEKLALALNALLQSKEKIVPSALSKDVLIDTVKNVLRIKKLKYLLIFDNAETYAQIEKLIPYSHEQPGKHILLTSRNANIWQDKVELGKFKRRESLNLISNALPKENHEEAEKLAETLSDYPLGLTIAVGFIKSHPTTNIDQYLKMYLKRTLKKGDLFIKTSTPNLDSYSHDVQTTLSISLKSIEEQSPEAVKALFFMSLLNSKDIPEEYIRCWLKKTKSHITAAEVIKDIYDQSLIEISATQDMRKNAMSKPIHYLSIHDLIHQLINESLSIEEKRKLLDVGIEVMLDIFSGRSDVFAKKILSEPIHLLHAQKLCENARAIGYSNSMLVQLKICIFECLVGGFRDFEQARLLLENIEEDLKFYRSLGSYYEALFMINKGFLKMAFGNAEEAIHYMSEGLVILNSLAGYDEERLRTLTNLAQYHTFIGETDIAEEFIQQGLEIYKKSKSEVFNCVFLLGWSFVLISQGRFEESLDVLNKVSAYPSLGTNYPTVEHSILHLKAETFIKLRRFKKAKEALEECEKKTKAFYQARKSATFANNYVNKGFLLIEQNKVTPKIFQILTEALSIYSEAYRGDKKHARQGRTRLALGKAYTAIKGFKQALNEYSLSDEIFNTVLKDTRIDDVSDLYKELSLLGVRMKDEELTHKYLAAHIHTFGLEHPRTKEIIQHLDEHNVAVFN